MGPSSSPGSCGGEEGFKESISSPRWMGGGIHPEKMDPATLEDALVHDVAVEEDELGKWRK